MVIGSFLPLKGTLICQIQGSLLSMVVITTTENAPILAAEISGIITHLNLVLLVINL